MICYRDRSFCADQDQCATTECDRRYTARDEEANTCNLPVSMTSFKATCGKFKVAQIKECSTCMYFEPAELSEKAHWIKPYCDLKKARTANNGLCEHWSRT